MLQFKSIHVRPGVTKVRINLNCSVCTMMWGIMQYLWLLYLANHSLHLFTLCSVQNSLEQQLTSSIPKLLCVSHFATASSTYESCSHFFSASTLLDLRCGRGARKMASAQRMPEVGHSCIAFAISVMAMFCLPPRTSILTASSLMNNTLINTIQCSVYQAHQSSGHWGFFSLPFSKTERALVKWPKTKWLHSVT